MKHPKFLALPFITFLVVIVSQGPARAYIATTVSGTHVSVSNAWHYENTDLSCLSFYYMNYMQRMTISGQSMMVPTEYKLNPGYYDLTFWESCDGYYIYGLGPCGCLTEFPEATPQATVEVTTEFYKPTPAVQFTTASIDTGVLWIRKEKETKN